MSSILRALKKLENEPRHQDETRPLNTKFVPLADTGPQKKPLTLILLVLGAGIVCGLIILGGWWLMTEKSQPPSVALQQVDRQDLQQPEKSSAARQAGEMPEAAAILPAPPEAAADIAPPPETIPQVPAAAPETTAQPAAAALAPDEEIPPEEPRAESALPATAASVPPSVVQAPTAEPAVADLQEPGPAADVREIEIPLLNDPEINLQAITWSKDPQKRLAVVNNRILRQGEMVGGYLIDAINQDDIVLSDKGEKWKLLFRIK